MAATVLSHPTLVTITVDDAISVRELAEAVARFGMTLRFQGPGRPMLLTKAVLGEDPRYGSEATIRRIAPQPFVEDGAYRSNDNGLER